MAAAARETPNGPRDLNAVQRWFQAVVSHPGGVDDGIEAGEAQSLIPIRRDELERVVRRSKNLGARDRLSVYANAYYARLLECLGECFPVLKRAVGDEVFHQFAFGYLQAHPSQSYTLGRIGDHFARYLEDTRPDRAHDESDGSTNWPDFLIDLARLEWTIDQVFDGPGIERTETLGVDDLRSIPPKRWTESRLVPAVCVRLLTFRYPVNDYYTAVRRAEKDEAVPTPDPCEQFLAITRLRFVVRRFKLTRPQFALLETLHSGETVGEAIQRAAALDTDLDTDRFAASLNEWFREWTANGFFQAVE